MPTGDSAIEPVPTRTDVAEPDAAPPERPTPKHEDEDFDRYYNFIQEFNKESDRAIVILAAAKIDQLLCEILEGTLLPVTTAKDELLESDGPLASFSSRIALCTRMGLIDAELTRAMQLLRKIRNAFAHEVTGCSLEQGQQADRVRQLAKTMRLHPFYETARDLSAKDHSGLSAEFRACVAMVITRLEYWSMRVPRLNLQPITLFIPATSS
jgi:DNA-binding MltR family transcriptional regulator